MCLTTVGLTMSISSEKDTELLVISEIAGENFDTLNVVMSDRQHNIDQEDIQKLIHIMTFPTPFIWANTIKLHDYELLLKK